MELSFKRDLAKSHVALDLLVIPAFANESHKSKALL